MLAHWMVAQGIKNTMVWVLIPYQVASVFWETWHHVYRD